jgi:hypothetical protein
MGIVGFLFFLFQLKKFQFGGRIALQATRSNLMWGLTKQGGRVRGGSVFAQGEK